MKRRISVLAICALATLVVMTSMASAQEQKVIKAGGQEVAVPQATVPEIFTMQGEFVRIAYNNEGWVTLGYRVANESQGKEWMLLEIGLTVLNKEAQQHLTRDSFQLKMPDDSLVPLATQPEFQTAGYLKALNRQADHNKDSVNYFPAKASRACKIPLFTLPGEQTMSVDSFEANWQLGCLGRIFFQFPEGATIQPGQYWLVVSFKGSSVEVPFRVFTQEEQKYAKKNWKDIKKQHENFLKEEAKKAKSQQK